MIFPAAAKSAMALLRRQRDFTVVKPAAPDIASLHARCFVLAFASGCRAEI
jgi:hypothetical protein